MQIFGLIWRKESFKKEAHSEKGEGGKSEENQSEQGTGYVRAERVYALKNTGIYLFNVNYNRGTRTRCQISLKLTRKTPERRRFYC